MNKLFRIVGQAIVTITWVVVTFVKRCVHRHRRKKALRLASIKMLRKMYDNPNIKMSERQREIVRKTLT